MASPSRRLEVTRTLLAIVTICVFAPSLAQAQVTPVGQLGVRYRGFFLADGPDSEIYDNRPESDVRLGARLVDRDLSLRADLVLAVGDGRSPSQRWTMLPAYGSSDPVHIDTAALAWRIDALPELEIQVGRASVPWVHTGLVWDEDVRLPIVAARYVRDGKPDSSVAQLRFTPAYLYLSSGGARPDDEVWALAGELGATLDFGAVELQLDLGTFNLFGHRHLGRAIARGDVRVGPNTAGFTRNTTPTDAADAQLEPTQRLVHDGLASRFHLVTVHARLEWELTDDVPGALETELVYNAGAADPGADLPLGVALALSVGALRDQGDGEVALEAVYIGADATLDLFNRDIWGTNIAGGGVRAGFVPWAGLTIAFRTLLSVPVDDTLRATGQARGEVGQGDELAVQVHTSATYAF